MLVGKNKVLDFLSKNRTKFNRDNSVTLSILSTLSFDLSDLLTVEILLSINNSDVFHFICRREDE